MRFTDHTGETTNGYLVVRLIAHGRRTRWLFRCQCGEEFEATFSGVSGGHRGCRACRPYGRFTDITGQTFGRLRVMERVGSVGADASWRVECVDCRKVFERVTERLKIIKKCPCNLGRGGLRHGHAKSATYRTWQNMIGRCIYPSSPSYSRYGGRGVTVCDEWRSFDRFLSDMGERPAGTTLDRIDGTKGYAPDNCRWATPIEQRRNMPQNTIIEFQGESMSLADWARRLGIDRHTLRSRVVRKGWPIERALTTPVKKRESHR